MSKAAGDHAHLTELTEKVFEALRASVDTDALGARLAALHAELSPVSAPRSERSPAPRTNDKHEGKSSVANALLERWSLADVLDDSILLANPSDKGYPLRLLFGEMSATMATSDEALTFAAAVNFFFRTSGEEESRVALGMEVSRAFYAFARTLEPQLRSTAAPILATLLSSELPRLRFESVDHLGTFDSNMHERDRQSGQGGAIREVRTFLCRITASGLVRTKARVLT